MVHCGISVAVCFSGLLEPLQFSHIFYEEEGLVLCFLSSCPSVLGISVFFFSVSSEALEHPGHPSRKLQHIRVYKGV